MTDSAAELPGRELPVEDGDDPFAVLRMSPDGAPLFVACVGRKGSGKSHLVEAYARSWPYDGLVIDPTGDFDPDSSFTIPWPGGDRWPERQEGDTGPRLYRVKPNRRQAGHREEVDRILGLAHDHDEPTMIVIDEGRYLIASDEKVLPNTDVVLNEGRHGLDHLWVANPRAIGLRPVVFHQADLVVVFDLPNEADQDMIAGLAGIDSRELADEIAQLELADMPAGSRAQPTGFLVIDKMRKGLYRFPPLPT